MGAGRIGRLGQTLAHYRTHRVLLRDDLGVEPDAKLAEFAAVFVTGLADRRTHLSRCLGECRIW
jgi:hypothetical protein